MNILFVLDQFNDQNNGTTVSAKQFADMFRNRGHNVRVLCIGESNEFVYGLKEKHIPIFQPLIHNQGMMLAKAEKEILNEAISWADLVHIYIPTPLGLECRKVAEKLNTPHTAAFHVQPEHITYNIGLSHSRFAVEKIYRYYRNHFFNFFTHIHCPSQWIADELKKRSYTAELHVISNGVNPAFKCQKKQKSKAFKHKFCIIMVGRLSPEKKQELLIQAVLQSPYEDQIQLIFAGKGPRKNHLERLGKALTNPPVIHFYKQEQLAKILSMCDLYVHTSEVESESISCVEAFHSGLVPVIAKSPFSATSQFALDNRSLFDVNNVKQLTQKIDYWFIHPEERKDMEKRYAEYGKKFQIEYCVDKMEEMFNKAIEDRNSHKGGIDEEL